MSTKLPWTRLFADKWAIVVDYLPAVEGNIYMRLRLRMLRTGEPLFYNIKVLSHYTGYSVKKFEAALNVLLEEGYLIRLADGRLWNLDVEEELNNSNENLDKASEKASKAAKARWDKNKDKSNDDARAMHEQCISNAYAMLNDAININNNNIYKKTKTIVLAKKEIGSESLETTNLVQEPTEVAAVDSQSEQIETLETNQPIIHEQESVPKKAKRVKTDRGCRLPADFEPDCDFAIREGLPPERVKVEIAKFRDYWNAKAGKDASKRDWQATWRNWVRKAIEDLQKGKNYGKPSTETTEQQRGWSYRVAQHMSNIKNSDSVYKFLFEDDNRTTIPLENGAKTIDCRSGENYLISP
ncbi:Uncharacterized protein conserved in bacteria [Bartonella grahamii]|uniref:Uncharacterized protein conserved in bacteria n=1 Tax=Bartonella grahamii TaxID=33045 RepID=A0A336NF32_BARGR|nr:DUF1376 domain-containing protein [Bartonella grahamii]SSZ40901.1 Uncharacterized protein conserved in bacteria [Bartonella grahamii]